MIYNLTNVTSAHEPLAYATAVNDLTGGMWASMLLLIIFLVLLVATKNAKTTVSFGSAAIITAVLAIFFRLAQLIPDYVLIMASVLAGIGFIIVWFD